MASFEQYRQLGFTTLSNALLAFYSELGLRDEQLIIILQLEAFSQRGDSFPDTKKIAANTNFTPSSVGSILQGLIDANFLELLQGQDDQGRISNSYSLAPLYNKLDKYVAEHLPQKGAPASQQVLANDPVSDLVRKFEMEFGRLLSPIEREQIADWVNVDHYDPQVVELALRQSVFAQVYNFKYIDRILLNWQRLNLQTPQQVQDYLGQQKRF
jgi:DNA replication protein